MSYSAYTVKHKRISQVSKILGGHLVRSPWICYFIHVNTVSIEMFSVLTVSSAMKSKSNCKHKLGRQRTGIGPR